MKTILEATNLSFAYGNSATDVIHEISFSLAAGESVGLAGANGAGKSTLLKIFPGLLPNYRGFAAVDGHSISAENLSAIRQSVGYVFQVSDSQLFMETVKEDVAFGPLNQKIAKEEAEKRVQAALRLTRIENLADRQIYRLSGGQKKLVAIAGVLAMQPEIILFDEPSATLDPVNRENLACILNNLPQTKFIASHDLDFILDTCQRVILLADGRITADGKANDILSDQALLEANGLRLPLSLKTNY